jgi:hypothetical protein
MFLHDFLGNTFIHLPFSPNSPPQYLSFHKLTFQHFEECASCTSFCFAWNEVLLNSSLPPLQFSLEKPSSIIQIVLKRTASNFSCDFFLLHQSSHHKLLETLTSSWNEFCHLLFFFHMTYVIYDLVPTHCD